jgi:hypothetical protein
VAVSFVKLAVLIRAYYMTNGFNTVLNAEAEGITEVQQHFGWDCGGPFCKRPAKPAVISKTSITHTLPSSVSSSYSSPPWLGAVKFFRPPFFAFPIISPSSLPLHSGGAWLWGWFSRGRLSISPPCGRFKDGSRIEAPSSLFAYLGNALQLDHSIERRYI